MTRILENKAVCVTVFALFTLAVLINMLAGGAIPAFGASPFVTPQASVMADGPVFPPDPWDTEGGKAVAAADGPVFPPDPWDTGRGKATANADGPVFPPDPWDTEGGKVLMIADGPVFPPDPWDTEGGKKRS